VHFIPCPAWQKARSGPREGGMAAITEVTCLMSNYRRRPLQAEALEGIGTVGSGWDVVQGLWIVQDLRAGQIP